MRCVLVPQPGSADALRIIERPRPRPAAGELSIRVVAAGLNRLDILQRQGRYPLPPGASDVLGVEAAGIVEALGPEVQGFAEGDRVCAVLSGGGYAECCVAPASQCLPVPGDMPLLAAAALPEALFTVWSTVWNLARLSPGETLLVHGGASGIGTTAIQMAVALGHEVYVTAGSEERCQACRAIGAARAINYRQEDFVDAVRQATGGRGVDVILDMVGGAYVPRDLQTLSEGGRLVFISSMGGQHAQFDIREVMLRRLTITGFSLRPRSAEFKAAICAELRERIWPLVASARIRPVIDTCFELKDVILAHRRFESGAHIGKVVLAIDSESGSDRQSTSIE